MNLSPIESINHDVFGEILAGLNHVTGTQGLINSKDIPFVFKYARSLACTSRKMNSFFNEELPTQVFLNSMAKRFDQPLIDFALEFNTRGSLKCVWSYIQKKGLDKDYAEIRKIYSIALVTLVNVDRFTPDYFYNITSSGIQFVKKTKPFLATPFGKIKIRGSGFNHPWSGNFIKKIEEVYGNTFIVKSPSCIDDDDCFTSRPHRDYWKILEAKRLGKDPFEPKIRAPKFQAREKLSYKNISEFGSWIKQHLDKLCKQPRKSGLRFLVPKMSENQMRLIELLNDSAKKILNAKGWLLSRKYYGLVLSDNNKACHLDVLVKTFEEILKHLTDNLTPVKYRDHPFIQYVRSEEEFQLFDSKTRMTNELLLCVLKEFGFDETDDFFPTLSTSSTLYWVRKKKAIEDTGLFKPGSLVQKELS